MSASNSIVKPTKQEEAELARLNEMLQQMEEAVDNILMEVSEQRLYTPCIVEDKFSTSKETKLNGIEDAQSETETTPDGHQFEKLISDACNSHALDIEKSKLQQQHDQISTLVGEKKSHCELLQSALCPTAGLILPQARHLARLPDLFSTGSL